MRLLFDDARYGLRSLCRTPGVTSASLLCLIVGIAVNTSIFSVLNGILWRPLALPEAERIVTVWDKSNDGSRQNIGYATFADIRSQSQTLESVAAVRMWMPRLTGSGEPRRLSGAAVTHEGLPRDGRARPAAFLQKRPDVSRGRKPRWVPASRKRTRGELLKPRDTVKVTSSRLLSSPLRA